MTNVELKRKKYDVWTNYEVY